MELVNLLMFAVFLVISSYGVDALGGVAHMQQDNHVNHVEPQKSTATPPVWNADYQVTGVLQLPYAEIEEPFIAYYSPSQKKSRIDYYGDLVITIQDANNKTKQPYGIGYKVAYMSTEKALNTRSCFTINGTAPGPSNGGIEIQTALPDLTGFKMVGQELMNHENCSKWENTVVVGYKKSVYTMWVTADGKQTPVRYEMMGYDSLFGSHYDKYYVDYSNYVAGKVDPKQFDVPEGLKCGDFPGPGASEHHIVMNPMREYLNHDDTHIEHMFHSFKKTHAKQYKDDAEHEQRKNTFRHNVRYIHSKNRANLGFTLAVNHIADWTDDERRMLRGRKHTPGYNGGLPFNKENYNLKDLPDQIDWRLYGAVTPVKDQAVCGSCWSFGTTGAIEGALFVYTQQSVRLSQQELMDCSWGEGNNACDGGEDFRAYQWIMKNGGLASEEDYGAYLAQDGKCAKDKVKPTAKMTGYVNVTSGDAQALQLAISHQGPVSVGIDAAHKSLSFYSHGVYFEPKCGNKPDDLDHAVLAVGYGTINGENYWLIKNSWSTYWGNDGYVLMSAKDNNCGVATAATYVIMH